MKDEPLYSLAKPAGMRRIHVLQTYRENNTGSDPDVVHSLTSDQSRRGKPYQGQVVQDCAQKSSKSPKPGSRPMKNQ